MACSILQYHCCRLLFVFLSLHYSFSHAIYIRRWVSSKERMEYAHRIFHKNNKLPFGPNVCSKRRMVSLTERVFFAKHLFVWIVVCHCHLTDCMVPAVLGFGAAAWGCCSLLPVGLRVETTTGPIYFPVRKLPWETPCVFLLKPELVFQIIIFIIRTG